MILTAVERTQINSLTKLKTWIINPINGKPWTVVGGGFKMRTQVNWIDQNLDTIADGSHNYGPKVGTIYKSVKKFLQPRPHGIHKYVCRIFSVE